MGYSDVTAPAPDRGRGASSGPSAVTIIAVLAVAVSVYGLIKLGPKARPDRETYDWTPIPCRIVASAAKLPQDSDSNYGLAIKYQYTIDGLDFTSDVYGTKDLNSDDIAPIQRALVEYPAGSTATCFVNPSDPNNAILHREAMSATVFEVLSLAILGATGMLILLRRWHRTRSGTAPAAESAGRTKRLSYLACLLFGSVMLFVFTIPTLRIALSARSWTEVPATIVISRIQSHDNGNGGKSYQSDILFRYEFQGRSYLSNWDSLGGDSFRSYRAKQQIIDRHPPGTTTIAYVDPADPVKALLDRSIGWSNVGDLFSILFFIIGGVGSLSAWRTPAVTQNTPAAPAFEVAGPWSSATDEIRLSSGPVRAKLARDACVMAVIWNAVSWAAVLGLSALNEMASIPGVVFAFGACFGLVIVVAAIRHLLCLFNPNEEIILTPSPPRLGDTLRLRWRFSGRAERITCLRMTIVGRESAHTPEQPRRIPKILVNIRAVDTSNADDIAHGEMEAFIPHEKLGGTAPEDVIWSIEVHGTTTGLVDVRDKFDLPAFEPQAPSQPSS